MKILHLIDEPWDSGLTAYALQAAELLQQAGQEVVVGVLPGKKPEAMARERSLKTIPITGVLSLRRMLRLDHWDVINVHTGRTHTWAIFARLMGGKSARRAALVRTRGDARPLKGNFNFKLMYKKTDAVIAASEHVRNQYEDVLQLGEDKARTIYPAVQLENHGAPPKGAVVGILGRLDLVKGHTVFLEAAAQIVKTQPDIQFLVAGKEAGIPLQLLMNQVAELGLGENIKFFGYVPSPYDFMRQCTIGVIASIGSEEVSRACLEWMATGRPVVGTIVGCLPELIEPEESGLLVSPGDSVALSEAISRLIRDPHLCKTWGKNAQNLALNKYSPAKFLEKTLACYTWAIAQNKKKYERSRS